MDPLDAVTLRASCQNSRPFVITLDDYTISTTSGVEPFFVHGLSSVRRILYHSPRMNRCPAFMQDIHGDLYFVFHRHRGVAHGARSVTLTRATSPAVAGEREKRTKTAARRLRTAVFHQHVFTRSDTPRRT